MIFFLVARSIIDCPGTYCVNTHVCRKPGYRYLEQNDHATWHGDVCRNANCHEFPKYCHGWHCPKGCFKTQKPPYCYMGIYHSTPCRVNQGMKDAAYMLKWFTKLIAILIFLPSSKIAMSIPLPICYNVICPQFFARVTMASLVTEQHKDHVLMEKYVTPMGIAKVSTTVKCS